MNFSRYLSCAIVNFTSDNWVDLGVKTCEVFLCFVAVVRVRAIMLTSSIYLLIVTGFYTKDEPIIDTV